MAKKIKKLVIVESPGKIKTINKILGSDYTVMASYGHVRDLPKSKLGIDLDDYSATYVIDDKKKKVIDQIKAATGSETQLFLCSDPDREGEAIAFHLSEVLGLPDARVHRVTFNEITPKAINDAFKAPRKIDMNLVNSQQARRFVDRIVGYQLSPLLWDKVLLKISAGRVQSVAVRLVSEREKEIQAFKADEYWTMAGTFTHSGQRFEAYLREFDDGRGQLRRVVQSAEDVSAAKAGAEMTWFDRKADIGAAKLALQDPTSVKVNEYETKEVVERAYPPFATSSLQQSSANLLGYDTKRTMQIAQDLYEGVPIKGQPTALITYMRTDSFSVSKDAQEQAKQAILSAYGNEFYPDKPNYYKSKKGSQEAHECIRPAHVEITPTEAAHYLDAQHAKLYELIWRRFISSQMAPAVFDATACDIYVVAAKERGTFRATGRRIKFEGWRRVGGYDKGKETILPLMKPGDAPGLEGLKEEQHFTEPPPRYNEASLVKTLESEGIGRPSTYSSILTTIQDRGYVVKAGTGGRAPLKATALGMVVTESLVGHMPLVMEIGFTRDMEDSLDDIEEGKTDYKKILKSFYKKFKAELDKAKKNMPSRKGGEKTDTPCPKCGKPMTKRLGRMGYFLTCDGEECGATLNVNEAGEVEERTTDKPTGIKCDKCGADVVMASSRFGQYLRCAKYGKGAGDCGFTIGLTKDKLPRRRLTPIQTEVKCEKCHKDMVIRVAGRRKQPRPFLSCSGFPKCKAAMDLPAALSAKGEEALAHFSANRAKDKHDAEILKEFLASQDA